MKIEDYLSIVIATYNHCSLLESTLQALLNSPVRDCRITVLDNKSTDGTCALCREYSSKFKNLKIYTQPVNLGGGSPNYMHGIEFCDTEYIWHLADDDVYDFSHFEDVEEAIFSNKYNLIQVGAHTEGDWNWGIEGTPRELYEKGYNYFRFSSFLPCDIFRFSYYTKYIYDAYLAISCSYPHMPSLIAAYKDDVCIYLSKYRIVKAVIGQQTYASNVPIKGFILLSEKLDTKSDKRRCILSQLSCIIGDAYPRFLYHRRFPDTEEGRMLYRILFKAASFTEKIKIILSYIPVKILGVISPYKGI